MSQQEQEAVIIEYNKIRENMESEELLSSVLELPVAVSGYIIKLKEATKEDDLEKVRDYLIWKKYFAKLPVAEEISELKEEFYEILHAKYTFATENSKDGYEKQKKIIMKTEKRLVMSLKQKVS